MRTFAVLLLALVLGWTGHVHAAPLAGWAVKVPGLGTLALYGATPERAIHNYVEGVVRRGVFPGREGELRAWGRKLAVKSGALPLERALAPGKPVSGVQLNHIDDLIGGKPALDARKAYATALHSAGLQAIFLPPGDTSESHRIEQRLSAVHHLHLTGGDDLHPSLWGAPVTHAHRTEINLKRDLGDVKTVLKAIEMGLPIDSTCRGYQLLNVALGGSMTQDILADHLSDTEHFAPGFKPTPHPVIVEPGSTTAATVGKRIPSVPSMHHQALARIAATLRLVGRAPDGVPEMIEGVGDKRGWLRGAQFHAELARRRAFSRAMYRDMFERATLRMNAAP